MKSSNTRAAAQTRLILGCYVLATLAAASLGGTAAQTAATCPDLTTDNQLWFTVIKTCASSSQTTTGPPCGPCHCALVDAISPQLQQSGAIMPSEMYTGAAVNAVASTMASCMRDFAMQVLESTDLKITQLISMEACVPDTRAVTQCLTEPAPIPTQQAGNNASEAATIGWTDLVRDASCALAASANVLGINATADNINCQLTPAADNWLNEFVTITFNPSAPSQDLTISARTTKSPVAWRAGCWCDETYDPVCDPKTRIQYPSPCSAECQYVASTVPCSALEPLVKRGLVPGSTASVLVYDESLYKAARQPVAFSGPPSPTEVAEDTQLFYYYYEEDVDDTQDAIDMAAGFVKAMMAANLAQEESAAAAAIATTLPAAVQAGAAAAANSKVTAQDGTKDSRMALGSMPGVQRVGGLLALLMNGTAPRDVEVVARVQNAMRGRPTAGAQPDDDKAPADERRTTVSLASADDAALPSWLSTESPDQNAGVYIRNPNRTSRILSALMAAASESSNQAEAASIVDRLAAGIEGVLNATGVAAQARRGSLTAIGTTGNSPISGKFRGAQPLSNSTLLNTWNLTVGSPLNSTLSAFNRVNGDANLGSGQIMQSIGQTVANTTAELRSRVNSTASNITNSVLSRAGLNVSSRSVPAGQVGAFSGRLQSVSELAVQAFDEVMNRLGDVTESLNGAALSSGGGNLLTPRVFRWMQTNSTGMNGTAAVNGTNSNATRNSTRTPQTTVVAIGGRKSGKQQGRRFFFL